MDTEPALPPEAPPWVPPAVKGKAANMSKENHNNIFFMTLLLFVLSGICGTIGTAPEASINRSQKAEHNHFFKNVAIF
jgi:hypothetical protein